MMFKIKNRLIWIFLLSIFQMNLRIALIFSQERTYEQIVQEGSQYILKKRYEAAERVLKTAIQMDPKRTLAYLNLGYIEMIRTDWGQAKNWFDKVFDAEPDNILAHYQAGICDREEGISRDPVSRRILWHNAKKHFLKVIEQDSAYKEVFNEYAHLKRYHRDYDEAIDLCLTQIRLRPELARPRLDVFDFYDFFLHHGGESVINIFKDQNTYQMNWLKERSSDYDKFFLGEKYRRLGRFAQADSIFLDLLQQGLTFSKLPIFLARVRLLYQTARPEMAEKVYWQAIDSIQMLYEIEFVYNDVKYILSDKDLYIRFADPEKMRNYYRRFWNMKNPLPGSKFNARLAEHYKRLVYAEEAYRYDGFRLYFNNPDVLGILKFPAIFYENTKLNDKGLVYIRYGAPDEFAISSAGASNESWLYHQTQFNPKLIFHFEIHEQGGAPGNWRLVPVPSDPQMLESRLGWDHKLDRYYMAQSPLERMSALSEIQIEARNTINTAMEHERHTWAKEVTSMLMYISSAKFISDTGENSIDFYIAIPKSALFPRKSSGDTCRIETGLALHDSLWNTIYKQTRDVQLASNDSAFFINDLYIDIFKTSPAVNKLHVASHIKNLTRDGIGGFKYDVAYKPFVKSQLSISDLVLAYTIEPATKTDKFSKHSLRIIPNPSQKFNRSELIHLYYEIYNLSLKDDQTKYKLEQTATQIKEKRGALKKILGIFRSGKSKTISIHADHQGTSSVSYEHTAFDFSEFNPGVIELIIKITDMNSSQMAESKVEFELF